MRTYPAVILSSLALVTSLESAAAAAASTSSPTQSRATLDSGHEHRVRTSGRALRVHERVDEDEDEDERVGPLGNELAEGIAKLNDEEASISRLFGEEESLSTLRESVLKHFGHEESLSPLDKEEAWENFDKLFHLPRNPDLLQKISVLSDGLENQQVMMVLAETDPDQLLDRLSDRYGEVSLLVALVAEGKRKDAPQYAIALKAMQMKRLVEMGITPKDLVNELEFVRKNVREHFLEKKHIRYDFDSLDQFLEAYNEGKDVSEQVTLLQALRASGTWESNKALLKYLESRRYSSHVAMDAYRELDAELARERRNVVDAGEEQ